LEYLDAWRAGDLLEGRIEEPATQPWGKRDAAVRDPAGNRLRIEQA
jgi:uncharacterized glyoxalase superfamily protein PhnB